MRVVQVLDQVDVEYGAIDVLPALQPLREVTAEISDWQTFPQLYVNGELLGGADIVEEMFESGELAEALGVEQPEVATAPHPARRPARRSPRRCRSNSRGLDRGWLRPPGRPLSPGKKSRSRRRRRRSGC